MSNLFDNVCRVCNQSCSCSIYGSPVEHTHLPGGLPNYPLCHQHQAECLAIHRPLSPDGTWRWVENCSNTECGFCKALAAWRQK